MSAAGLTALKRLADIYGDRLYFIGIDGKLQCVERSELATFNSASIASRTCCCCGSGMSAGMVNRADAQTVDAVTSRPDTSTATKARSTMSWSAALFSAMRSICSIVSSSGLSILASFGKRRASAESGRAGKGKRR